MSIRLVWVNLIAHIHWNKFIPFKHGVQASQCPKIYLSIMIIDPSVQSISTDSKLTSLSFLYYARYIPYIPINDG